MKCWAFPPLIKKKIKHSNFVGLSKGACMSCARGRTFVQGREDFRARTQRWSGRRAICAGVQGLVVQRRKPSVWWAREQQVVAPRCKCRRRWCAKAQRSSRQGNTTCFNPFKTQTTNERVLRDVLPILVEHNPHNSCLKLGEGCGGQLGCKSR